MLLYVYQTMNVEDHAQVKQEFENALREGAEKMPTIAEYCIQQGIEKGIEKELEQGLEQGIEKGLEQEAREAVLDILHIRFNKVSKRVVGKIIAVEDITLLRELRRKALMTESLNEFEQCLSQPEASED